MYLGEVVYIPSYTILFEAKLNLENSLVTIQKLALVQNFFFWLNKDTDMNVVLSHKYI